MNIQPVPISQLEQALKIFTECRIALEKENIFQWIDSYPDIDIVAQDINNGHLYGIFDNDEFNGVVCLNNLQASQYASVQWQYSDETCVVIHRLAITPTQQKRGLATRLMDFAENFALEQGFTSIRLDAYSSNKEAMNMYIKRKYQIRGEVYFQGRKLPFLCFEKNLRSAIC